MKKKTISILALSLALSVSSAACTGATVYDQDEIIEHTIDDSNEDEIQSSELVFQVLLNEYNKTEKGVEEILESEDQYSDLYSSALYVKLREFGLDDQTIMKELYNVVNFGLVHPYEDGWKNDILVHNLNNSLSYNGDAICYYYPLAAYVHLFGCKQEHETAEGRINCETIQENLAEMNESILFYNYLVENVLSLDSYHPAKLALYRIINSSEDTLSCLCELETIYKASGKSVQSIGESTDVLHLQQTLNGEKLDPFSYYYDLACFSHSLRYFGEEVEYDNTEKTR